MAFDVQTLNDAARCAECLSPNQKQNVLLYLLNGILLNGASGGGVHDLLSASHPDTLPAAVLRGSLIVGNATPLWAELTIGAAGTVLTSDGTDASWTTPASAGTVTSFSAGNLAPLFTTSVATAATTPALTFSLSTQAANLVFAGPASGAVAAPTFRSLVALDLPATAVVPATYGSATQVGQFTVDQQGRITAATDVAITFPGGFSGFANPTALVGLAAVNGVATTAMRSDGAPALDQSIVPTWTGTHTFTASATIIGSAANALNAIQIVPPAALGSNMVDLFSDGGPGYNAIRKYFSSPFQVEIASSGSIDFVTDSNGNETGATVKFLTNALRGGVQTTLFTFNDNGSLFCTPTAALAIRLDPFGAAAGNTSEIRFLELAAGGTNYTGFKAPDAITASEIYVLPNAAPSANRFLQAAAVAGGVSALSWAQASLTADVTGTLPVGNGGTGITVGVSGGILGFTSTTTLASSVLLTANALVLGGGAGATPVPMASLGTTTTVLHGNAAGAPTFSAVSLTADVSGILPVTNGGSGTSTSFTAGSVIFAGAAGVYAQDNANFFYTDASNLLTVNQLSIPNTTSATVGGIYFSTNRVFHNFGSSNIFVGLIAGNFTMTGIANTSLGQSTLASNTTGISNAAIGFSALMANTTGSHNMGVGNNALTANTIGVNNSAIGSNALAANIDGGSNVAIGKDSLIANTSGSSNTGAGDRSLLAVNTGSQNIGVGALAGRNITTGIGNICIGFFIDSPTPTNNFTLTIGNLIFGTGLSATTTTISTGNIGIGVITPLSKFHVVNSAAGTVAEIIKAAAAQSANLTEWQSSAAVANTVINAAGNISIPTTTATVGIIFQGSMRLLHTFGTNNLFLGPSAGNLALTGVQNIAIGEQSLLSLTNGVNNTALGFQTLPFNTTGGSNSAFGFSSLFTNVTGSRNMGFGYFSLYLSTGDNNIGIGYAAGDNLTTGSSNIILGYFIDSPTATNSNTLTIGNLIFGSGLDGIGTALSSGGVGIRVITPTAKLHLCAGTTAASTAPLKFNTGTSMTAAEAGAVEFTTDDLFFTITTGAARKRLIMADATAGLTSGKMPIATTNGRLIDLTASSAYTPTNVTTDRSYDANATTLDELSDVVGTMIADLQAKGILG